MPTRKPKLQTPLPHKKFSLTIFEAAAKAIIDGSDTIPAIAHLWLGRMLGWEWMAHKAELFGLPIRWATYDPNAPQAQIDAVSDMLRNMGTAAWGAFPQGTDLQMINGTTPGVAGASEPTARLMYLAGRACDLIFLGQTLTSSEGSSGSYALGSVHREVELDLYENYAAYVIDVINNQFIPAIIELNWGKSEELPFLEVELDRPEKDKQIAERDKLLFQEMGLPVSKQWLYDRHKVPAPGPKEDLFEPNISNSPPYQGGVPEGRGGSASAIDLPTFAHSHLHTSDCVHAQSESTESLNKRKAQAQKDFAQLLITTDLETHDLVWASGDCPVCSPLNGTTYPDGWTTPPPLHHDCDCVIDVQPKAK